MGRAPALGTLGQVNQTRKIKLGVLRNPDPPTLGNNLDPEDGVGGIDVRGAGRGPGWRECGGGAVGGTGEGSRAKGKVVWRAEWGWVRAVEVGSEEQDPAVGSVDRGHWVGWGRGEGQNHLGTQ